jgi:small subunit ribosomal protein S20
LANIPSQIKRNRQNEKRRLRNRGYRGAARTAVKNAFSAMTAENPSAAETLAALRALDKAAQKGAVHHRNASRRKSRLMKRLSALGLQLPAGATAATTPERAAKPEKGAAETAEAKPKAGAKKSATKKTTRKAAAKKSTKK